MKNLSSEKTWLYKYIVPYLAIILLLGFVALSIYGKIYLAIIFPIIVLLGVFKKLYILKSLVELSVSEELQIFEIKKSKSKIILPFKDLRSIRIHGNKTVIELRFNDNRLFFMPKNTGHFFPDYDEVISYLRSIIRNNGNG